MAAAGQGATGLTFWNKVYGFDYSLVQQELREDAHQTALLKDVSRQDMLSTTCQLRQLDIAHMTTSDASFSTHFMLEPSPEVRSRHIFQLTMSSVCAGQGLVCPKQPMLTASSGHWHRITEK